MAPPSRDAQLRGRLLDLLAPAVRSAGYDLEDVAVSGAGRRTLVRVTVDADGGIDLDAVADVSRAVSDVLDEHDEVLPGPFVLEVSSPGVDRPLTEPRHWRRAAGRLVETTADGEPFTGRVVEAGDAGVGFDVDGQAREVPWAALGRGRIRVEFTHGAAEDDAADEDLDDADTAEED
jgi:ribosome maturation factor RimP